MNVQKVIAYVSSEWYSDTDMSVLHHLSKEFKVTWIYLTNTIKPRVPLKEIKEYSTRHDINIYIIPANYKYLNLKNIKVYWNLYHILYKEKFDIIYMVGSIHLYRIPFELFLKKNIPIIQGVHDVKFHSGIRGEIIFKLSYKWMFSNRKFFCVFSKTQYDIFRKLFPSKKVELLGMSVKNMGESTQKKPELKNGIKLLFFGRIDYYKGLDILINAIEQLYEKGINNIHLTIAGTGRYWNECKKEIKTPSLYNLTIRFIQVHEIPDLIMSHHFLVLPYRDATQSGPVMIAANYGLPIIAPRIDSFLDIYKDEAAEYYEKGELKKTLLRLSRISESEYLKIKKQVEIIRNTYSEDAIACNYLKYFNSIINQNCYDN